MQTQQGSVTDVNGLYRALGSLIRSARRDAELTQEGLAQRVGLTRTSLSNLEHGRQRIQVHTLYAIADALGIRPEKLLPSSTVPGVDTLPLPEELQPAEREWVRRVLNTAMERPPDEAV